MEILHTNQLYTMVDHIPLISLSCLTGNIKEQKNAIITVVIKLEGATWNNKQENGGPSYSRALLQQYGRPKLAN